MTATRWAWALVAAAAVVATLFFAGYTIGAGALQDREAAADERGYRRAVVEMQRELVAAESITLRLVDILRTPGVARSLPDDVNRSLDKVGTAIASGDYATAADALPTNIIAVTPADCFKSGIAFAALAGTLVTNCETGMTAVLASLNSNRTANVTIGDRVKSGAPGASFEDTLGRFKDCRLVYHNLVEGSDPLAARMHFDCR